MDFDKGLNEILFKYGQKVSDAIAKIYLEGTKQEIDATETFAAIKQLIRESLPKKKDDILDDSFDTGFNSAIDEMLEIFK